MAKKDKEFMARMQGMIYALNIAKEKGVDALEKDIRKRGVLNAPIKYTTAQLDEFWNFLSQNLQATTMAVIGMVLRDKFHFGKKRLKEFKEEYDRKTRLAVDLDWIGEHYVTLEDYAEYLNKDFNLDIDADRVAVCQESYDKNNPKYGTANMDHTIKELEKSGFKKAANFLKKKTGK